MKYIITFTISISLIYSKLSAQEFARGADVGWLSEMEDAGRTFNNDNGQQEDLLDILSDHCINSIRLRVWVDPENWGDYSGKADVLKQAKRAWDKGFRIMIDFHYSDNWADPGKQYKPAAWGNYSVAELTKAVYDHTYDVLNALKQEGVTPEWVQIGNETNDGMLWDEGRASLHMDNYAAFISSGHIAAKAVFPNIVTVVHVANGWDRVRFQWNIDGLVNNNAQFDAIGMSLYPDPDGWQTMNSQCLTNMQELIAKHNKPIVISEIGMSWQYETEAKAFVEDIIVKNQSLGSKGLGVFWWEPQCYDWQGYDKGAWNPSTKQPTIALDGFSTNCTTTDCNGVDGGTAFIDNCGTCVGGNTGKLECSAVDLSFTVDMTGADVSNGVYITGDMTSEGSNWAIIQMDSNGDNTYSATFSMYPGDEGAYYYLNANDWNARETVPAECADMYDSDRAYTVLTQNTNIANTWAQCAGINIDCNGTPLGLAYIDECGVCVGGTTGLTACIETQTLLSKGWNLVGCPIEGSTAIGTALASIWDYIEIVKDMDGFYDVSQPDIFNTLNELRWGKGYFVKVSSNCILSW